MTLNSERDFYSHGLAVGSMDIRRDVAIWRFRDEIYETSAVVFWAIKDYAHRFPVAPIEVVRNSATTDPNRAVAIATYYLQREGSVTAAALAYTPTNGNTA